MVDVQYLKCLNMANEKLIAILNYNILAVIKVLMHVANSSKTICKN